MPVQTKKRVLFTGGGSAGHVTVNLALIPQFLQKGWQVDYIGSYSGIERELVAPIAGVHYFGIATGKLRRYFDWNNVKDPFRVVKGVAQAYSIIRRRKPDVVFSKGGFVSVPVILGAWLNRIPAIIHESDLTPGLANRIAMPFASKVCTTFPETARQLPARKAEYVGAVVRQALRQGNAAKGRHLCGFSGTKPVLLVMGGSLGARRINEAVRQALPDLLARFQIMHLCGRGQVDTAQDRPGYKQFEYLDAELPDVLSAADLVVSRSGSNSIFEFLALRKPMLLIPLPKSASRGDQILNAQSFERSGYADILWEEELTPARLAAAVLAVYDRKEAYIERMRQSETGDAERRLIALIEAAAL